jgi:hypothetical protein
MKAILTRLLLTALALPVFAVTAHAGQWTIEETDDNYVVEYKGDPGDKTADKAAPKPGGQAPGAPAASAAPAPATYAPKTAGNPAETGPTTDRPARVRDQSRRERAARTPRSSGSGSEPE